MLNGRESALASEELALRARLDLDHGRYRETALQVLVALDAAIAELALDPTAGALAERLDELRDRREQTTAAARRRSPARSPRTPSSRWRSRSNRIEAIFRARAVANA